MEFEALMRMLDNQVQVKYIHPMDHFVVALIVRSSHTKMASSKVVESLGNIL